MPRIQILSTAIILIFLLNVFHQEAHGQHKQLEKTFINTLEGDYEKAQKNLLKLQEDYSGTIYESAALYYLYSSKSFSGYDPDSAYYHLQKVKYDLEHFINSEDIQLIQLRMRLDANSIIKLEQDLAEAAWGIVQQKKTFQAANEFFKKYDNTRHQTEGRLRWRDNLEVNYYIQLGDTKALKEFEKSDRNSYFKTQATSAIDSIDFSQAKATDSEEAWLSYIKQHPKSKNVKTAQELYELLVFRQTKSYNEPDSINRYLSLFPQGKYRKEALAEQEKSLFIKLRDSENLEGLLSFRKKYIQSEYLQQVESLIESISWQKVEIEGSLEGYISYLESSTQLIHLDEAEQGLLRMWPETWQPSYRVRLIEVGVKVRNIELKSKIDFAVGSLLLDEIEQQKNLSNLENFLRTNSDSALIQRAKGLRQSILLHEYKSTKKYDVGISFITEFPTASETPSIREELAEQFLLKVPKGGKPDLAIFMQYFENTRAFSKLKPKIEKEYFAECSKRNTVQAYREYLEKYPNGAYVKRAETSILLAWNDSYIQNRQKLFNASDFDFTVSFYLSSPVIRRFFKSNTNELRDILAEYYAMQQDKEENKYYFYSGNPDERYAYFAKNTALLQEMGLSYEVKNNALYVDGITFYDKRTSKFCWECSQYVESEGNGSVVILDNQSNQLTGSGYQSIVATGVPHVFLVKNAKNKYSLFNTRERSFITGWHNEITPILLDAGTFPQNSLEYSLLRIFAIPIGFLTIDEKKNCYDCDKRLINFSGQLLIDPEVASDPCLFDAGMSERTMTTLTNAKTFEPLRNHGAPGNKSFTNYFVFQKKKLNKNGSYDEYFGILNGTLDTVLVEANYTSVHSIDDNGLVSVQHKKPSKGCKNYDESTSDLIDIHTKKNITNNPGGVSLRDNYIPFSRSGEIYDIDLESSRSYIRDVTPQNNYSIEEREEFEGYDEDIEGRIIPDSLLGTMTNYTYTFPRSVFYFQELRYSDCNYKDYYSYELLNGKGTSIYKTTSRISQHSCFGNKVLFQIDKNGCILLSTDGRLIFDGAKENYYMQFINHEYLYYWRNENSAKSIGIYSVSKGKVCEAIYENIKIETDGVYGYKLGVKTKLEVPLKNNRTY
jgi:hypothetical protein